MNRINQTRKWLRGVLLGTLIVVSICGCGKATDSLLKEEKEGIIFDEKEEVVPSEGNDALEENNVSIKKEICVYVCGSIAEPGVYTLLEGSRICDLFKLAGGLTAEAATDYWNQAKVLCDGEMIYVPTESEAGERPLGQNTDTTYEDGKVNINSATKAELMTLPGIGESKADAILSYRERHGKFSSVTDIQNVEGIKAGVYAKIEQYIKIN